MRASRIALTAFAAALPMLAVVTPATAAPIPAATIYYNASQAGSWQGDVATGASIWNSSVRNVRLQQGGSATLNYYLYQSYPGGSQYQGDMHGSGTIIFDINQVDNQLGMVHSRVTAHETGHALGLYDAYNTPCRNLMSGGEPSDMSPGQCTSDRPTAQEAAQVDQIWAGYLKPGRELTQTEVRAAMADIAKKQAKRESPCVHIKL
ncbi:snapalysin family zinc-dependent metalloprotease [Pseudonocardiaceae bacterium YIM PH 21723]|nr:snapalysin family zinc-dependent metalloprotease [Pseudonocardiaceae bacterium YIM PH 21723]